VSLVLAAVVLAAAGCGGVRRRGSGKVTLAVLPVESARYPQAAKAITKSMGDASVPGVDDSSVAAVSLEVAQLSIECVEPTVTCYTKVGRSLDANRLMWAEIGAAEKKKIKVTVTLFDVDARKPHSARRVFASEKEATQKIGELVSEATR
jgi:hypothetical protein